MVSRSLKLTFNWLSELPSLRLGNVSFRN